MERFTFGDASAHILHASEKRLKNKIIIIIRKKWYLTSPLRPCPFSPSLKQNPFCFSVMFLPYWSMVLIVCTQMLLCLAAGGRGKEPIGSSASFSGHSSDFDAHSHPSEEFFGEVPGPNLSIATQKEVHAFANRYLKKKGVINNRMTKEEWSTFQENNRKETVQIWKLYRERKRFNKILSRLRKMHANNPENPNIGEKLQQLGLSHDVLLKGGEKGNLPRAKRAKVHEFLSRIRIEMKEVETNPGAQRRRWDQLQDQPVEGLGILIELNNFRDVFRKDPYDPQLKPMLDHVHESLRKFYGRRFDPLILPIPPPGYEPGQKGVGSNKGRYGTSRRRNRKLQPVSVGLETSSHQQIHGQSQGHTHDPTQPLYHDQSQNIHHELNEQDFSFDLNHFNPHIEPELTYFHPNMNPNYFPQGVDLANVYPHLDPH